MAQNKTQQFFTDNFPHVGLNEWKKAAARELDGSEPFAKLSWNNDDELDFLPYYTAVDVDSLSYLKSFQCKSTSHSPAGRNWDNLPFISVNDVVVANKSALEHLNNGADGVLFDCSSLPDVNFQTLLNEIQWQYCNVSFRLNENASPSLKDVIEKKNIAALSGCFFWDNCPQSRSYLQIENVRSLGLWIRSSTAVNELVEALVSGVNVIETLKNDQPVNEIISNIAFSFSVNTDFLMSIVKLRVARILWYQITRAYGVSTLPSDLHLHVRSEAWANEKFQPHANMLKGTTAAMASISGGSDSISIIAEQESQPMMNRVARNVSNILKEEAHFNKVVDPFAGSYAIEAMTDSIAKKAWSLFTAKTGI